MWNRASGFVKAELSTCRHSRPRSFVGCSTNRVFFWVLDSFVRNGWMEWILLVQTRNIGLVTNIPTSEYLSAWQILGNFEIAEVLSDYVASNPQREQIYLFLSSWLGISKWIQVPGFNVAYAKSTVRNPIELLECEECEKRFHASCSNLVDNELLRIESGDGAWYCINCKADCGLCSSTVLKGHKAVQCDSCDMWIHNECSFIAETQYETVNNTNCTWICPKCEFFNVSDSFFGEQVNLETENRFVPLTKAKKDRSSPCGTNKSSFISGLKFISMNINSIRGKKLELLAFLDFHQPHVVAIQETKIHSSIATSELFPETCTYSVYRKDRNIHGVGVMLLVHKDISHMPVTDLENDLESIWVKVFANETAHFVASWYRPPGSTSEEFHLFREQLDSS